MQWMKHAWSAMSPSPRHVNTHHLHSLCDSADVFPRLLRGRMTQLELPLFTDSRFNPLLSQPQQLKHGLAALLHWGQNTGWITCSAVVPNFFLFVVPLQHYWAPLLCATAIDGMVSWNCLIIFHHKRIMWAIKDTLELLLIKLCQCFFSMCLPNLH